MQLLLPVIVIWSLHISSFAAQGPILRGVADQMKRPDRQSGFDLQWELPLPTKPLVQVELFQATGIKLWTLKLSRKDNERGHRNQGEPVTRNEEQYNDEMVGQTIDATVRWFKMRLPNQRLGVLALDVYLAKGLWSEFYHLVQKDMKSNSDAVDQKSLWLKTSCEKALSIAFANRGFEKHLGAAQGFPGSRLDPGRKALVVNCLSNHDAVHFDIRPCFCQHAQGGVHDLRSNAVTVGGCDFSCCHVA